MICSPLWDFYKSLWFNGFNSLRGQTHAMKFCLRRLMMTVDSGVHSDQPKIFSFFFMAIDYFWLENFDGHAKLCHLSIQIFIRYKNFRLNRTFQRFGEFWSCRISAKCLFTYSNIIKPLKPFLKQLHTTIYNRKR